MYWIDGFQFFIYSIADDGISISHSLSSAMKLDLDNSTIKFIREIKVKQKQIWERKENERKVNGSTMPFTPSIVTQRFVYYFLFHFYFDLCVYWDMFR